MKPVRPPSKVAVLDFETDPFLYGRVPEPFAAGLEVDGPYFEFWGDDCIAAVVEFLNSQKEPLLIYAHNGGKFDFYFLLEYISDPIRIINGRIVECRLGIHTLRDSFAAVPVALKKIAGKLDIEYWKMERECREEHKAEILEYLRVDCVELAKVMRAFIARFSKPRSGPALTMAGAAMTELQKRHRQFFKRPNKDDPASATAGLEHDEKFRLFYFGGRVQAFEKGVIRGQFRIYDVNSMYPAVMRNFDHPLGSRYVSPQNPRIGDDGYVVGFKERMFFIDFEGMSHGHLPERNQKGGIDFPRGFGRFTVPSHEFRAVYIRGLVDVHKIHRVHLPYQVQRFVEFVDTFAAEKVAAGKAGDKITREFVKLVLASAYGKFAQDPRKFRDYIIERLGIDNPPDETWALHERNNYFRLWKRPTESERFNDVAIAASITGAARAVLLDALCISERPIYCDTDSLICHRLGNGTPIDPDTLGAWKFEGSGDRVAIGGKKLYAVFDGDSEVKSASKGVKLSPIQIQSIAEGATIEYLNDAPTFKLHGQHDKFVKRKVKLT